MFNCQSRRHFLKAGIGSLALPQVLAQTSEDGNGDDEPTAEELWNQITSENWGYEAAGLEVYHEETGDLGKNQDILVIDRGFHNDSPILNVVDSSDDNFQNHEDYYLNIYSWQNFSDNPFQNPSMSPLFPFQSPISDSSSHGTGITSVVWQAAPNARYHLFKITDMDDLKEALKAAQQQKDQYDVVLTSQGLTGAYIGKSEVRKLANEIPDSSTCFVAAAGNDSLWPQPPSTAEKAISVASLDTDGSIFPGGTPEWRRGGKPDVVAPGNNIVKLNSDESNLIGGGANSSYAAPHVAGIALLLSQYGTAPEVREAIKETAIDIPGTELDGEGRVSTMDAYQYLTENSSGGGTPEQEGQIEFIDCTTVRITGNFEEAMIYWSAYTSGVATNQDSIGPISGSTTVSVSDFDWGEDGYEDQSVIQRVETYNDLDYTDPDLKKVNPDDDACTEQAKSDEEDKTDTEESPVEFLDCSTVEITGDFEGWLMEVGYLEGPRTDATDYLYGSDYDDPIEGTTVIDLSEISSQNDYPRYIMYIDLSKKDDLTPQFRVEPDYSINNPISPENCKSGADEQDSTEDEISVRTGNASPNEDTPRFVTFNGQAEGVPADTSVIVGFEYQDYNAMWSETKMKELTSHEAIEFSITEKMPYVGRSFPYRAIVQADGKSIDEKGETREVNVPNFLDTVEIETVDVTVSGRSATVTGHITDFGKAATVSVNAEISKTEFGVDVPGPQSSRLKTSTPELSRNGTGEFSLTFNDLDTGTEYWARTVATLPVGPVTESTYGDGVSFETSGQNVTVSLRPEIVETNTPIKAGEQLEVEATIENTGTAEDRQEISLSYTHNPGTADTEVEEVDSTTISLGPGEAQTVYLDYVTPEISSRQTVPIYVESEDMLTGVEVVIQGS